jgi:hypothetical protein
VSRWWKGRASGRGSSNPTLVQLPNRGLQRSLAALVGTTGTVSLVGMAYVFHLYDPHAVGVDGIVSLGIAAVLCLTLLTVAVERIARQTSMQRFVLQRDQQLLDAIGSATDERNLEAIVKFMETNGKQRLDFVLGTIETGLVDQGRVQSQQHQPAAGGSTEKSGGSAEQAS